MFKHVTHLLLIAESKEEAQQIDLIIGDCGQKPLKVTGELTCDDGFNPYFRFVSGKATGKG